MEPIEKILGENIKELRLRHNWSQLNLAEMCEVDQPTIQRWEKGKTWPQPKYLKKLSAIFNISTENLFKSTDLTRKPSLMDSIKIVCNELGFEAPKPLKRKIIPEIGYDLSHIPTEEFNTIFESLSRINGHWDMVTTALEALADKPSIESQEKKKA